MMIPSQAVGHLRSDGQESAAPVPPMCRHTALGMQKLEHPRPVYHLYAMAKKVTSKRLKKCLVQMQDWNIQNTLIRKWNQF